MHPTASTPTSDPRQLLTDRASPSRTRIVSPLHRIRCIHIPAPPFAAPLPRHHRRRIPVATAPPSLRFPFPAHSRRRILLHRHATPPPPDPRRRQLPIPPSHEQRRGGEGRRGPAASSSVVPVIVHRASSTRRDNPHHGRSPSGSLPPRHPRLPCLVAAPPADRNRLALKSSLPRFLH
uniref:Uncharacterized protein n=1 Tax=Oryza punctata TaxID=4537 RepID=A0A0E0JJB2_ORYPU